MRYLQNVVTLQLNEAVCIGCGRCVEVCPHAVFNIDNSRAAIVDRDACMECGACARNCPVDAVTVDAGVGCVTGLINRALGRKGDCCCVLEPFHAAVGAGQTITRQLLDAGWQRMLTGTHQDPGNAETPVDELPAVRL
jgi:NAD-dependent dihydropyrimidine dehydrogenase PreA subunit